MTKDNEPIYRRSDGDYVINNGGPYRPTHDSGITIEMVEAYLLTHPEALIPEPKPPEPTQEELDMREEQGLLAYLASTDWYAVRYAETGDTIPAEVKEQRAEARARISELRTKADTPK